MKQVILSAFLILLTQPSLAISTEFGNGGNAVVCSTYDGESVTVYDLTETVLRYRLTSAFPTPVGIDCQIQKNGREICQTGAELVRIILKRLQGLDFQLMKDLALKLNTFWSEASLVHADLPTVNDQGLNFVPEGCKLKQLAIQQKPVFAEDSRYFISSSLWQKMSEQDKAALILHEIIYRHALEKNPDLDNSVPVRYFNALLISDKIKDFTQDEYGEVYRKVFIP